MENRKQKFSLREIKEIDMVDYLYKIGTNWNRIDFAMQFFGYPVGELIRDLKLYFSFHQPLPTRHSQKAVPASEKRIKIVAELPLSSPHLLRYLEHRRIAIEVAEKYCREVRYELGEKTYYGIGFRNDLGGYEIRNPYVKMSSSPKGITTLKNNSEEVIVFEGFMDFLSFKTIRRNLTDDYYDFVVLNSVSFFERTRPFLEDHRRILLFLDRDQTGQNCSRYALSLSSQYEDHRSLYQHHKDFNDWMMNFGKGGDPAFHKREDLEDHLTA